MKTVLFLSVLLLVVFAFHCKDDSLSILPTVPRGTFSLSLSTIPSGITRVVARLARRGFDTRVLTLTIADSGASASGTLNDIAVGTWHLNVDALDDQGHVRYSGQTDVDVQGGQTTQVALQLNPTTGNLEIIVTWGGTCVPAPSGLVSWWNAEDNANDIISANNGVFLNGATVAQGKVGNGFSLDGVNDYIRIPNSSNLNPRGSFTIDAWIYPLEDKWATIMCKWADYYYVRDQRSYNLEMSPGLNVGFAISDSVHQNDPGLHIFRTLGGVLTLNTWNHVAGVYDRTTGTRRIYVNGIEVAERTDSAIAVYRSIADVTIGAAFRSETVLYETLFPGRIDEVDFFSRALTDREIKNIYLAGNAGKCR